MPLLASICEFIHPTTSTGNFWRSYNSWNKTYWRFVSSLATCFTLLAALASAMETGKPELWVIVIPSVNLILTIILWCFPHRGHTLMGALIAWLYLQHHISIWLDPRKDRENIVVAQSPPMVLLIFCFVGSRLHPVWPLSVSLMSLIVSSCIIWSTASQAFMKDEIFARIHRLHDGVSAVLQVIACIFGALNASSIFNQQREVFDYLMDHLSLAPYSLSLVSESEGSFMTNSDLTLSEEADSARGSPPASVPATPLQAPMTAPYYFERDAFKLSSREVSGSTCESHDLSAAHTQRWRDYCHTTQARAQQWSFDLSDVESSTDAFFNKYIKKQLVLSFEAQDEEMFNEWWSARMKQKFQDRCWILVLGMTLVVMPYLGIAWTVFHFFDADPIEARGKFHGHFLANAVVQSLAASLALCSAIMALCARYNKKTADSKVDIGDRAVHLFIYSQIVFGASIFIFGAMGGLSNPDAFDRNCFTINFGKGCFTPRISDPLAFTLFSAHSIWRLKTIQIMIFDICMLAFVAALCHLNDQWEDGLAYLCLVAIILTFFTLTLEKFDRIVWKLTQGSKLLKRFEDHIDDQDTREHDRRTGLSIMFPRRPTSMIAAPGSLLANDRAAPLVQPSVNSARYTPEIVPSVLGFSQQYGEHVLFLIEIRHADGRAYSVLQSAYALREGFAALRLLARQPNCARHFSEWPMPYLDPSFDRLRVAGLREVRRHAGRLERILRRTIHREDFANFLFGGHPERRNMSSPKMTSKFARNRELSTDFAQGASTGPITSVRQTLVPKMDILILTVGSRGDVQPFMALAKELINNGHRCRIATHEKFEGFVTNEGVEFFPLAGLSEEHWQPEQLMEYMEENPSLGPGMILRPRDLANMIYRAPEMKSTLDKLMVPPQPPGREDNPVYGFWAAAVAPDPRSGKPFRAQAIIANPPSYAHIHLAEKLGIPCQMVFTMPWTPTVAVGHPLGVQSESNPFWNKLSYRWVNNMQWTGVGQAVNRFRKEIGLAPIGSAQNAPQLIDELEVPFAYCFSPSLLEKPHDWGPHIDIVGFFFGGAGTPPDYKPAAALDKFLKASSEQPFYIGFGSISSDLSKIYKDILEVLRDSGKRAILHKGWCSCNEVDPSEVPPQVLLICPPPKEGPMTALKGKKDGGSASELEGIMQTLGRKLSQNGNLLWEEKMFLELYPRGQICVLEAVPHDWLFQRVSAVCHHGGAGTTAIGLQFGNPTIVCAFFGDQPLWGGLIEAQGAGKVILARNMSAPIFREAIEYTLSPQAKSAAKCVQNGMQEEQQQGAGVRWGMQAFHKQLPLELLQCEVCKHIVQFGEASRSDEGHGTSFRRNYIQHAQLYDSSSQSRLCEVCSYLLFEHPQYSVKQDNHIPGIGRGLALYFPLNWGKNRRSWLEGLGIDLANAIEDTFALPAAGLRCGGFQGLMVGGAASLVNLVALPAREFTSAARTMLYTPNVHRVSDEVLQVREQEVELVVHKESGAVRLKTISARDTEHRRLHQHEVRALAQDVRDGYISVLQTKDEAQACVETVQKKSFAELLARSNKGDERRKLLRMLRPLALTARRGAQRGAQKDVQASELAHRFNSASVGDIELQHASDAASSNEASNGPG